MKKKSYSLWWGIGILFASIIILHPLIRQGFPVTDDGDWMIIRLTAFFQSLREGQFPVRYLGRLNHSYGYPVANFLYPGFLYIGSFLHGLGSSFVTSVKLIMAGSVVISALLIHSVLLSRFRPLSAFVGALSFLFSPYVLYDLYRRGSVGEILAFLPMALTVYALTFDKLWILPFSIGLLLVSHNTLALFFLGATVLLVVWKKQRNAFWPVLLGVGTASFFWIPALLEQQFVTFAHTQVSNSIAYMPESMKLMMWSAATLLSVIIVFRARTKTAFCNREYLILTIAAVFFASPLSLPFWKMDVFARIIQFPYRFLAIIVIFGPWFVAGAFQFLISSRKRMPQAILLVILVIAPVIVNIPRIAYVVHEVGFYTTNEGTTTVSDEYMPRWVREPIVERSSNPIEVYNGTATIDIVYASTQRFEVNLRAEGEAVIQVNKIYYPGWGAVVDGISVPIRYDNPKGIMLVTIPNGEHTLRMEFRETVTRFIADLLSAVCVVLSLVYFVKQRYAKKVS